MKKFVFLLLVLVMASCSVTTVAPGVKCYKNRICTGDQYAYRPLHSPDGYDVEVITIIQFSGNTCEVRKRNGDTYWITVAELERKAKPVKQHNVPPGKAKGHYK